MADFSANATQLPAASGAVSATQGVATPVSAPMFPEAVLSMGVSSAKQYTKDLAAKKTNNVTLGYQTELTTYAQALETGQVSPEKAQLLIRSAGRKYAAMAGGDPELVKQLSQMHDHIFNITSFSQIEASEEQAKEVRSKQITQAIGNGYYIPPNASQTYLDSVLTASAEMTRIQQEQDRQIKLQQEQRATMGENRTSTQFEQQQNDYRMAQKAQSDLQTLFRTQWDVSGAFMSELRKNVRDGTVSPEEALISLQQDRARNGAMLTALANQNPELARPYQTLFQEYYAVGEKMLDPASDLAALQAQVQRIELQSTLMAYGDDSSRGFIMSTKLLGPNVLSTMQAPGQFVNTLARLSQPMENLRYPPQVVGGDPEVQDNVYRTIKGGVDSLRTSPDPEAVKGELSNVLGNLVKSVGNLEGNAEVSSADFRAFTEFMADPKMVTAIQQGLLADGPSRDAAKRVWQYSYEQDVVNGIETLLNRNINPDPRVTGSIAPAIVGSAQNTTPNLPLKEYVDVAFDGSSIKFSPRTEEGRFSIRGAQVQSSVNEMNTLNKSVNTLIRAGAHLEGHTNYGKYWEDNKHIILPSFYADPNRLKQGDVIERNGRNFRYNGGITSRPGSWEEVGAGSSE